MNPSKSEGQSKSEDNSSIKKLKPFQNDETQFYFDEEGKLVVIKPELSNQTLSTTVYSKINKGGMTDDQAVIRAVKEKGVGGVNELFTEIKPQMIVKSKTDESSKLSSKSAKAKKAAAKKKKKK